MLRLTPFLLFDGNCAEAMHFYSACLGGELELIRLGETPMKAQLPESQHAKITYGCLKSGLVEFSATDWLHPTRLPKQGNTVGMYVTSVEADELYPVFARLSEGAPQELLTPLQQMPFGLYGQMTDRYGVMWFFRGGPR